MTEPTLEKPMTPLAFVDTETDGLGPWRKPWDIAVIRRAPDGTEQTLQLYVDIDLSTADLIGLKIGRFYDRHPLGRWLSAQPNPHAMQDLRDYPLPEVTMLRGFADAALSVGLHVTRQQAARLVARWTHGCHVVGAVPNFDTEVFDQLLREEKLVPAHHYHLIDVETLAVGYLHGRHAERPGGGLSGAVADLPWDSEALSQAVGIEPLKEEHRHTALGDAWWAMQLWDRVTGGAA
jgi:hypothetical protein